MDDLDPGIEISGGVRTTIRNTAAAQLSQKIRRKVGALNSWQEAWCHPMCLGSALRCNAVLALPALFYG